LREEEKRVRKFTDKKEYTKYFRGLLPGHRWGLPLFGLAIALGIVADRCKPVFSNQLDNDPYSYRVTLPDSGAYFETWKEQPSNTTNINTASTPQVSSIPNSESIITAVVPDLQKPVTKSTVRASSNYPQKDGVYLYGQSPQPGQLGQGYIVFQKSQGRVVGALYMPDSEYSCFNGTVDQTGELAMTVNPPGGEGGQTQVATAGNVPKINQDESTSYAYSLALRHFHPINKISAIDRQI
jgi:hypothetical protein